MAEAAVDDSVTNRFFCHKCNIEIMRVLEDYTCPTCRGGFIEELDSTNTSSDDPSDDHSDDEVDEFFNDVSQRVQRKVQNLFGHLLFGRTNSRGNQDHDSRTPEGDQVEGEGNGRRYRNRPSHFTHNLRPSVLALIISLVSSNRARLSNNSVRNPFGRQETNLIPTIQTIEDFYSLLGVEQFREGNISGRYSNSIEHFQDFIVNLTGLGWGPMGPGGRGNEPVFFLGNPGDYAWGREGLDTIVSQLLNQMDVSGPPPLDKEKIREIPVTVIEQEQVDSNLQCSVCWDDFKVGESVRKLECEHFYHESCIVPWLELHGTCPICRKSLLSDEEEKSSPNPGNNGSSSGSNTRSNLAAMLFRGSRSSSSFHLNTQSTLATPAVTTTTAAATAPTAPAAETNTSSGNETAGRQPQPPSSDYQMDTEFD